MLMRDDTYNFLKSDFKELSLSYIYIYNAKSFSLNYI